MDIDGSYFVWCAFYQIPLRTLSARQVSAANLLHDQEERIYGESGLLKQLTKMLVERVKLTNHLDHDKRAPLLDAPDSQYQCRTV